MKTRIREMREDRDLTQEFIGSKINVKQRTYSRYECEEREIPLEVLCRLADFYEVSTDYLLFRTDNPDPYKNKKQRTAPPNHRRRKPQI